MIQRIQTLYLLLVVILGTLLCFFSPVQFLMPDGTEYIHLMAFDKWPLAVLTLAIPVLALIIILHTNNNVNIFVGIILYIIPTKRGAAFC